MIFLPDQDQDQNQAVIFNMLTSEGMKILN